jgi:hypothetical protein
MRRWSLISRESTVSSSAPSEEARILRQVPHRRNNQRTEQPIKFRALREVLATFIVYRFVSRAGSSFKGTSK